MKAATLPLESGLAASFKTADLADAFAISLKAAVAEQPIND